MSIGKSGMVMHWSKEEDIHLMTAKNHLGLWVREKTGSQSINLGINLSQTNNRSWCTRIFTHKDPASAALCIPLLDTTPKPTTAPCLQGMSWSWRQALLPLALYLHPGAAFLFLMVLLPVYTGTRRNRARSNYLVLTEVTTKYCWGSQSLLGLPLWVSTQWHNWGSDKASFSRCLLG